MPKKHPNDRGFSLLETILALGLAITTLLAVRQQSFVALEAASRLKIQAEAATLGQSLIAGVLAGDLLATEGKEMEVPEKPEWRWIVSRRRHSDGLECFAVDVFPVGRRQQSFRLERLILQPD